MSTKKKPLKRDIALIPFSREHHHSLLLSWKIRKGIANGTPVDRIKKYTDWFFKNHVKPHFEDEEKYIFPILGDEHELIKKALSEHRRLIRLFTEENDLEKTLNHIEEELERHIRFEERELFMLIQEKATPNELKKIEELHDELNFVENSEDIFWE